MKKIYLSFALVFLCFSLSGCNTLNTLEYGAKAVNIGSNFLDFDTNGYYSKSNNSQLDYCPTKINNVEVWKLCSKH